MDKVVTLKQGYQNFAETKDEAVLAYFQPDIFCDESAGFPFVEGNGIFHGHQEVVEKVFTRIPQFYDGFGIEIDELIDAGNTVVMKRYYNETWKQTGKTFKANATYFWKFKDEKAAGFPRQLIVQRLLTIKFKL